MFCFAFFFVLFQRLFSRVEITCNKVCHVVDLNDDDEYYNTQGNEGIFKYL